MYAPFLNKLVSFCPTSRAYTCCPDPAGVLQLSDCVGSGHEKLVVGVVAERVYVKGEDTYFPHTHYDKLGNLPYSWDRGGKNPCGKYTHLKTTCSLFPGIPLPFPWRATASSNSLLRTNPRPQDKSTGHLTYWVSLSQGLSPGGAAGAPSPSTYCLAGRRPTLAGILLRLCLTFPPSFPSSSPMKSKVLNKWGSHASILSDFPIPIQSTNSADSLHLPMKSLLNIPALYLTQRTYC